MGAESRTMGRLAGAGTRLELAQVADDGGLAQVERAGGASQAAGLSHGEEHAQIVPLHAGSVTTSRAADPLPIRSGVIEIWPLRCGAAAMVH